MTAYDASNPHQFDAYWRNSETGEMEGVTHEVYAQKRSAAKVAEQKGAEEQCSPEQPSLRPLRSQYLLVRPARFSRPPLQFDGALARSRTLDHLRLAVVPGGVHAVFFAVGVPVALFGQLPSRVRCVRRCRSSGQHHRIGQRLLQDPRDLEQVVDAD